MKYKGYTGVVTYEEDARIFHGEVIGTRDVITFQGKSVDQIEAAFRDSIDDYLEFCASRNEQPDKPLSGKFMLRISVDLHRQLYQNAVKEGKSLNVWIVDRLEQLIRKSA
jgi:predicted HicB family RNase H-like nuclease